MKKILPALLLLVAAPLLAATAPGGTLTVTRANVNIAADNSTMITLSYSNSGGAVSTRVLLVDPGCTFVKDDRGATISNPAPAALCTAITSFTGQLDSLISTASTGGKLNL